MGENTRDVATDGCCTRKEDIEHAQTLYSRGHDRPRYRNAPGRDRLATRPIERDDEAVVRNQDTLLVYDIKAKQ